MARFKSKRNRPDAKPATHMPAQLRRTRTNPLTTTELNPVRQSRRPVDYMARTQCVGTAKSKLRLYWVERMKLDGHKNVPDPADTENWNKISYHDIISIAKELGYETATSMIPPAIREKYRCGNPAIAGSTVCRHHGGSSSQVLKAARDNFQNFLMPAQKRHMQIITKGKHEPAVVMAIKEIYAVTGLNKQETSTTAGYSDELIARMAEIFTEEELEKFIFLSKKLQSALPESDDSEPELTDKPGPRTIHVDPTEMAVLIKKPMVDPILKKVSKK